MKRRYLLILLGVVFVCAFSRSTVSAQSVAGVCGGVDGNAQVSTMLKPLTNTPNVYARATLPEDQVSAVLYFQELNSNGNAPCIKIGSGQLSSQWQSFGTVSASSLSVTGTYTLVLSGYGSGLGASGPQLIFTTSSPQCVLSTDCVVTYKGLPFNLSPKKISNSIDPLRAGVLENVSDTSAVKEVLYSVDGVQEYKKKTLESFNEKYVPGGEHSAERTVILASGQTLSDKRIIKKGTLGNVGYLFTATLNRYAKILYFSAIVFGFYASCTVFLLIAKVIHRRRIWKATHIAGVNTSFDPSKAGPQTNNKFEDSTLDILKTHKKFLLTPIIVIALLFIGYSFVLSSFTVDGVSMFPTLHDKTRHPLFILPANLGKITGNSFTPARGTIVVVQKDDNNLFEDAAVKQKSYVVKRVVGLPDERVLIKDGKVYVFNKQHPDGFVPDDEYKWFKQTDYFEFIRLDIKLKEGELFVMGDNRGESVDSRFYGPIKASQLVGKVL